jgi:pyrimidine-nucleoside phosphorylase
MISGRGLGITGGTLDKLESIPGFNVSITREAAIAQLKKIGVVMMGQTPEVCPADKKLYALRDVTATVPSQPLIVASIMSKKLAETLDSLVLDVKYGSGAFMKRKKDAVSLAAAMKSVGEAMGVETHTVLNPMNEPLGQTVGNALEVREAIDTLRGGGPADLRKIVIKLAAKVTTNAKAAQLAKWLDDGTAWAKFGEMVEAHGGDVSVLDRFSTVHPAAAILEIKSAASGQVKRVDADTVGRASLALGAGRSRSDDEIDFSVGFDQIVKTGTDVKSGEVIGRVHAADKKAAKDAAARFAEAVTVV